MNLYAITAVYEDGRDTVLVLADDDDAALAIASRSHDPRGTGTTGSEVWRVASGAVLLHELPVSS